MRLRVGVVVGLLALVAVPALAVESFLGRIVATTAKNQYDTATPFTIPPGQRVMICCDALAYVRWVTALADGGAGPTAATTALFNYPIAAGACLETYAGTAPNGLHALSIIAASGTANCVVSAVQVP